MKKIVKNSIKIIIFITLANLPFITVTQIIGMDTFLDSFENPEYYLHLQDTNNSYGLNTNSGEHIIVQKSTHPDFNIKKSDSILYFKEDGHLNCNKVTQINNMGALKCYYIQEKNQFSNKPIYDFQVIGKVVNIADGNLWNSISLSIWETSINNLNLNALITNK